MIKYGSIKLLAPFVYKQWDGSKQSNHVIIYLTLDYSTPLGSLSGKFILKHRSTLTAACYKFIHSYNWHFLTIKKEENSDIKMSQTN